MVAASAPAAAESTRTIIDRFFAVRRFAAVGVSKNPRDFTRHLMRAFLQRGYDVVPVNPTAAEIEARKCYAAVKDIQPPVTAALLLTSPAITEQVVRDFAGCGVSLVWIYRATRTGAVSQAALEICRSDGISVIAGECPLMFLPHAGFVHQVHGFIRKIRGTYPQARSSHSTNSAAPAVQSFSLFWDRIDEPKLRLLIPGI